MATIDQSKLQPATTAKYVVIDNAFFASPKQDPFDRVEIEIGDSKQGDKFYPQVKVKRWDNEVNFSIRLVETDNTEPAIEDELGGKIKYKKVNYEAHFKDVAANERHEEGAFDFDVFYIKDPRKRKGIDYTVEFSYEGKGIRFDQQLAMTEYPIPAGWTADKNTVYDEKGKKFLFRPDDVIGSFAIRQITPGMNREDGKNYNDGKIGHLFYPYLVDPAGNKTRVKAFWIDEVNKRIYVTIQKEYLDAFDWKAGGLLLDPTFGYTTSGSSATYLNDKKKGNAFALAEAGTVSKLTASVANDAAGTTKFKAAIFGDSDLSYALQGKTGEVNITSTSKSWKDLTMLAEPDLEIDDWFLVLWGKAGTSSEWPYVAFDSGTTCYWEALSYVDGTADWTFNWSNSFAAKLSVYATYTASGGGATTYSTALSAKARIKIAGNSKLTSAKGRIKQAGLSKKITIRARLKVTGTTKKVTLRGRLKQTANTKKITARGRIKQAAVTKKIALRGRIKIAGTGKTTTIRSRIKTAAVTKKITSRARVKIGGTSKLMTSRGRIKQTANTRKITLRARIKTAAITKTTSTRARIKTAGITKKITLKARVKVSANTKTTTLRGRIKQAAVTKKITIRGRVKIVANTRKITAKARVKKSGNNKALTERARIKNLAVTKVMTMRARLGSGNDKLIQAKARIKNTASKILTAKARLKQANLTKTTSLKARVKRTVTNIFFSDEMVANGSFTGNASGWTLMSSPYVVYDDNNLALTPPPSGYQIMMQDVTGFEKGHVYRLTFDFTGSGKMEVMFNSVSDGTFYTLTEGTNVLDIVCRRADVYGSSQLQLISDSSGYIAGTIDNVSVKEMIGFSLRARIIKTGNDKALLTKAAVKKTQVNVLTMRGKIGTSPLKITTIRGRIKQTTSKALSNRGRIKIADNERKMTIRAKILQQGTATIQTRARIFNTVTTATAIRARIAGGYSLALVDIMARIKKASSVTMTSRARIAGANSYVIAVRSRTKATAVAATSMRARMAARSNYRPRVAIGTFQAIGSSKSYTVNFGKRNQETVTTPLGR
jgi:hypothetical protein